MRITEKLASYVVETRLGQMPQEVISRAKELLLNQIGATLAGAVQPTGEIVIDYVRHQGGNPQATVLGKNFKTSTAMAALANGNSAAALDYDDNSLIMMAHPSNTIVPAVLAFGEELAASGQDILEAHILGIETGTRLAKGFQLAQYLRGWHSTGTLGIIASTAACAKLAKLGKLETARAFGIAGSLAGGMRGSMGTMTKPFHSGAAAMQAVIAASLAKQGFTGSTTIFEHDYGYCALTAGMDNFHPQAIEQAVESTTYFIIDPGIGIKMYPCNSAAHVCIDNTIELVKQHDIKPDQVESIECGSTPVAIDITKFNMSPKTGHGGKYSLTYPIAISVVDRAAGIKQFTDERVLDPIVQDMVAKVKIYMHPDLKGITDANDVAACHLTIKLKDGREFTKYRRRPKSIPGGEPVTREELLDKYRECAGLVLSKDKIDQSIELVDRLETVSNISELTALMQTA